MPKRRPVIPPTRCALCEREAALTLRLAPSDGRLRVIPKAGQRVMASGRVLADVCRQCELSLRKETMG